MASFENLCSALIAQARLPFAGIEINYNLIDKDNRERFKRVLEFDPAPVYERAGDFIKPFLRAQNGLSIDRLFPTVTPGVCACGCGAVLTKKSRRYATKDCTNFCLDVYWIIYGRAFNIERYIWLIAGNQYGCMGCGDAKPVRSSQNDHTVAVCLGGGGCWISNFKRLCKTCHDLKTKNDNALRRSLIKQSLRSDAGPDLFS